MNAQQRIQSRRRRIAHERRGRMIHIGGRIPMMILIVVIGIVSSGFVNARDAGGGSGNDLAYIADAAETDTTTMAYKTVIIRSGDTIWGIAETLNDGTMDTRKLAKAICALNEVEPGKIYPGQVIRVPI